MNSLRRIFWDTPLPWWFSRTHWHWRWNQLLSLVTRRHYEEPGTYKLVELPCGCQDVHYADGTIDREHDHVECPGTGVFLTVTTFTLIGLLCLAVHLSVPWGHRPGT
jgi:hypothetical protein